MTHAPPHVHSFMTEAGARSELLLASSGSLPCRPIEGWPPLLPLPGRVSSHGSEAAEAGIPLEEVRVAFSSDPLPSASVAILMDGPIAHQDPSMKGGPS